MPPRRSIKAEDVERARSDRDRDEDTVVVAPEQSAASAIEPKLLEQETVG